MRHLLLIACLPALTLADDATLVRGELGAALDRAVQRSTGGGFWGVVLVAREGEVLLAKGYGFADYQGRPNTPRSLFEIASTSKPFTAAAVLKLQMEGKLSVDDPIAKHLDGVPEDKKGVTIHHLLTHTSGISPRVGLPYASRASRAEFIETVLDAPMDADPGEAFAYFNSGYALLAAIVEIVSGQSFEDCARAKLFKPAGMVDTGFIGDAALDGARVTTRLSERTPDATARDWHWSWGYRGMGGVVSTAYDLLRWDRALRGDAILDAATKERAYAPAREGYACGWLVGAAASGGRTVSHSGGVEGYGVNYVRYLEDDAVVVVLSNGKTDIHAVTKTLEDALFPPPRITARIDAKPYALSKYRAAEFEGTAAWRVAKAGAEVVLVLEHAKTKHAVATVRLPRGAARKLRTDLARVAGRGRGGADRMDAGAYLNRYQLRDGTIELDDGLEIRVMPRYVGNGPNGRIVDERVTLVLDDTKRRQWAIMAKMHDEAVVALIDGLQQVLK